MNKLLSFIVVSFLLSGTVHAGTWADGWGETPGEALESAVDSAIKAVETRGSGCYSGKIRYQGKVKDLYHFQALYHHHTGSCGQKSSDKKWFEKTATDLIDKATGE